jgi:hypothetical protein
MPTSSEVRSNGKFCEQLERQWWNTFAQDFVQPPLEDEADEQT